jgi:hypothetical protein
MTGTRLVPAVGYWAMIGASVPERRHAPTGSDLRVARIF